MCPEHTVVPTAHLDQAHAAQRRVVLDDLALHHARVGAARENVPTDHRAALAALLRVAVRVVRRGAAAEHRGHATAESSSIAARRGARALGRAAAGVGLECSRTTPRA